MKVNVKVLTAFLFVIGSCLAENEWIAREEFNNRLPATLTPAFEIMTNTSNECLISCELKGEACDSVGYSPDMKTCKMYNHDNLATPLPKLAPDENGHQMYYKQFFCPSGWRKDVASRTCYYLDTTARQRTGSWQVCEERLYSELVTFQTAKQRTNFYSILQSAAPSVTKWWTGYAQFDGALWPRPVEEFPGYQKRRGDCGGSDIMNPSCQPMTLYECYLLCERKYHDRCVNFNYNINNGLCCPKHRGCELSGNGDALNSGWWFYDKVHAGRPATAHYGGNCPGNDIKSFTDVTRNFCFQECRKTPHCVTIAYNPNSKTCWLKWKSCIDRSGWDGETWDLRDVNEGPCAYGVRYRDNCIYFQRLRSERFSNMDTYCRQLGGKVIRPTDFKRKGQLVWAGLERYGGGTWYDWTQQNHVGYWTTWYDDVDLRASSHWDFWPYNGGEPNNCCPTGGAHCSQVYGPYSNSDGNYYRGDDTTCNNAFRAFCETPISQSYPTTCTFTPNGREYFGNKGYTKTNMTCKPWSSTSYNNWRMYPDWLTNFGFCRNPDPAVIGSSPWCIRQDNNVAEACDVPMCPESDWAAGQTYTNPLRPYAAITYGAALTEKYDWTVEQFDVSAATPCSLSMYDWCPYYFRGSCYMIYRLPNNHDEARDICASNGWHLTSVTTTDEHYFLLNLAMRLGHQWFMYNFGYHIGLKGTPTTGFAWDNGEPYTAGFWQSGQPNGGGESCHFIWSGNQGWWHDYFCWFKTWFICEVKLGQ